MASFAVQFHELQIWECWLSLSGSSHIQEIISIKTGNNLCCFSLFCQHHYWGQRVLGFFFQPQFCSYLLFLQLKAFKIQPLDDCLTVSSQLTYNPADILDNVCFIIVKVSGRSCGLWRVFTETAKAWGSESSCHGLTTVPIPCPLMLFMSEKEVEEFWSVWVRLSLGRKQVWEKVGLPLWDFFLPFYAIFNWQLIQCSSSCFYFVHDSNL